jgi:hypothetical protein
MRPARPGELRCFSAHSRGPEYQLQPKGEEKPENTVLDWNFLARMGQVSIGGIEMRLENFGG